MSSEYFRWLELAEFGVCGLAIWFGVEGSPPVPAAVAASENFFYPVLIFIIALAGEFALGEENCSVDKPPTTPEGYRREGFPPVK